MKCSVHSLFLMVVLSSCGPRSQSTTPSTLQYGFSEQTDRWLITRPLGSTLSLCGQMQTELGEAINEWGALIGRNFQFRSDCSDPDVTVLPDNPSFCRPNTAGVTRLHSKMNPATGAYVGKSDIEIAFCSTSAKSQKHVLLHETGHAWGLCDQYPNGRQFCKKEIFNGGTGVMAYGKQISQDDIDGMRALDIAFPASSTRSPSPKKPQPWVTSPPPQVPKKPVHPTPVAPPEKPQPVAPPEDPRSANQDFVDALGSGRKFVTSENGAFITLKADLKKTSCTKHESCGGNLEPDNFLEASKWWSFDDTLMFEDESGKVQYGRILNKDSFEISGSDGPIVFVGE